MTFPTWTSTTEINKTQSSIINAIIAVFFLLNLSVVGSS